MSVRVAVVGTGAVGGYIGGHMARAGEDVILIGSWPAHIEYLREHGLQLSGLTAEESLSIPVEALYVSDVQRISKEKPIDVAFIAVKSYDTEWATRLIAPYLAKNGIVVSAQNCINEETIARVVGWEKTLGVVISQIRVELYKPGHVKRTAPRGGSQHTVFRVGEVHGRDTRRAREVVRLLGCADSAKVTSNLWGERWTKLIVNAMGAGLSSVSGLGGNQRDTDDVARWVRIRVGAEAVRVARALGYELEDLRYMRLDALVRAAAGDESALSEIVESMRKDADTRSEDNRPSMAQDIARGRRTETDYINGYVASKGLEIGVPVPLNARINDLIKRIERGELSPGIENLYGL